MEAEAKYTLVGVIVLLVVALLGLGMVWLGGWANSIAYSPYTIYFKPSVHGWAGGQQRGQNAGDQSRRRFQP